MHLDTDYVVDWTYKSGANGSATSLLSTYANGSDAKYNYDYDANGNITRIWRGNTSFTNASEKYSYVYDSANQLVRENLYYGSGNSSNATITYEYDIWGNLLNKKIYDGIGNPLSYRGWTMNWQGGRQLASMAKGSDTLSFAYNESGLRTSKTVNGVTHSYVWQGSKLAADITDAYALYFHYDSSGEVIGFTRTANGTDIEYFYVKNLQGDILKVITATGTEAATYTYDAWGKLLTSAGDMADVNPLRYRGYFYDTETSLYYLKSRYYDPEVGRFINSDAYASTGQGILGTNMFTYCDNNPIIYADFSGTISELVILPVGTTLASIVSTAVIAVAAVVAVVAVVYLVYTAADYVVDNINEYNSQHSTANIGTAAIPSAKTTTDSSLEKSQDKTREKIKKSDPRIHYWVALYIDYGGNRGTYIPAQPLQYFQAIAYVKSGGSVFADSRHNAYKLAIAVGQGNPYVRKEIHGAEYDNIGFWSHYHAGGHKGGHIFYV